MYINNLKNNKSSFKTIDLKDLSIKICEQGTTFA